MKTNAYINGKIFLIVPVILFLLYSCTQDKCEITRKKTTYFPRFLSWDSLRKPVISNPPMGLKNPGKIYYLPPYIYINEQLTGIHVVDNQDPTNPKLIAFYKIPGNVDIAIKSNILYADSYVDIVAIDISDPLNVKEKSRLKKVFPEPYSYNPDTSKGVFFEYDTKEELVTEPVD